MKVVKPVEEVLQAALEASDAATPPPPTGEAGAPPVASRDGGALPQATHPLVADHVAIAHALRSLRPEASPALRRRGRQAILSLGRASAAARTGAGAQRGAWRASRPALRLAALLLAAALGLAPMVGLAAPGQALYPLRQASAQLLRWAAGVVGLPLAEREAPSAPDEDRSGPLEDRLPSPAGAGGVEDPSATAPTDDRRGDRPVAGLGPSGAAAATSATARAVVGAAGTPWVTPTGRTGYGQDPAASLTPPAAPTPAPRALPPDRPATEMPLPATTPRPSDVPDPTDTRAPSPLPPTASASPSPLPPATAAPPTATATSAPPTATASSAPPTATATADPGACDAVIAGQIRREDGGSVAAAELLFIRVDLPEGAWSVAGVDPSGRFASPGLCAGDYLVAALLLDGPVGAWDGVHDADGDGDPDLLTLAAGTRLQGIDITLRLSPAGEPQTPTCPGPTAALSAELLDEGGQALPGATLHLFGPLGPLYEASADGSGIVALDGICPGFYQAAASFEGGPATLLGFYDPDDDGQPDWIDLSDPGAGGAMLRIRLRPVLAAAAEEGRAPSHASEGHPANLAHAGMAWHGIQEALTPSGYLGRPCQLHPSLIV